MGRKTGSKKQRNRRLKRGRFKTDRKGYSCKLPEQKTKHARNKAKAVVRSVMLTISLEP